MKQALFIFMLSAAGAVVVAYLTAAVIAIVRRAQLSGCGWVFVTWLAVFAVWVLLYFAGQISGAHVIDPPWWW